MNYASVHQAVTTPITLQHQACCFAILAATPCDILASNEFQPVLVMKVDAITLTLLLESMNEGVTDINLLLRKPASQNTIRAMARVAHKLKGEATVVGIGGLSKLIVGLEDSLERMLRLQRVEKAQLQVVGLYMRKIVKVCQQIKKTALESKAKSRKAPPVQNKRDSSNGGINAAFQVLALNVSRSYGKQVALNLDNFKIAEIPKEYQAKVQDIVIQLIRNAVAHGIETPVERSRSGKPSLGAVSVYTKRTKQGLFVVVRDNGRGIDLDEVRKRLVVKYDYSVMRTARLSREDLLNSLFLPGFSTLAQKQEHAGRGVGLDLVKEHTKSMGGKVDIRYHLKQYTQFIVQIPLAAKNNVAQFRSATAQKRPRIESSQKRRTNVQPPILVEIA